MSDPIQLTPEPVVQPFIKLQSVELSAEQATNLLTGLAAINLIAMPEGKTLADMRQVNFQPILYGDNAGGLRLTITVTGT